MKWSRDRQVNAPFQPNERIILKCQVTDSKPEANITWHSNPIPHVWKGSQQDMVDMGSTNRLLTTTSIIELLPTMEYHRSTITCEALHPALLNPMTVSATLVFACMSKVKG